MSKPKQQSLYISHNNQDDELIATIRKVIVNKNTLAGASLGDTIELQGSVFNQRALSVASRQRKLVMLQSGKITVKGYLESILLFRDKRYKTGRRFQVELWPVNSFIIY